MKTYTVRFAQDVPHYGTVEIEAENDEGALAKARAFWERVQQGEEDWPLYDAQHDSALLDRIVEITEGDDDREVSRDVALDTYTLAHTPTEQDARLIQNIKPVYQALKQIAGLEIDRFKTNDAEHDALFATIETARVAVAAIEGRADQ